MTGRRTLIALAIAASSAFGRESLAQNTGRVWTAVPQLTSSTRPAVGAGAASRVIFLLQRQLSPYWYSYYPDYYSGYYRDYYLRYYYNYYSTYRDYYSARDYGRTSRDYYTSYYPSYYYPNNVVPQYRVSRGGSNTIIYRQQPGVELIAISPRYTPARPPRLGWP